MDDSSLLIQSAKTAFDLSVFSHGRRKSFPVAQTNADEDSGRFSPDGHWIAFSNRMNRTIRDLRAALPGSGGKSSPISTNGGVAPQWRGDGKEFSHLGIG